MVNDLKSLQRKAALLLILDTDAHGQTVGLVPGFFQRAKPIVKQNICICANFFYYPYFLNCSGSTFREGSCEWLLSEKMYGSCLILELEHQFP